MIVELAKKVIPKTWSDEVVALLYLNKRLEDRDEYMSAISGKSGLEIGGPSAIFRTILPVYPHIRSLDGVNFSETTVWEGKIKSGDAYRYYKSERGRQFILEATDLLDIHDESYDFVLSSNSLEHVANPLKALRESHRVLRSSGALVIVLPAKEGTFDHRRPITSFDHLMDDFEKATREDDLTHLDEILLLHDLSLDPGAGSKVDFERRSRRNHGNRTLHHHVFDERLIIKSLEFSGFDVERISKNHSHYFALARKHYTG
jgi:SAM-dependent methyltransferase